MKTSLVIVLILFIAALACGWFYWYEYRPSQIRAQCAEVASEYANKPEGVDLEQRTKAYEVRYQVCINKEGLEE